MEVRKVAGELAAPDGSGWAEAAGERLSLAPIPIDAQPTEYIRVKWAEAAYGTVDGVDLAAATDGDSLYLRLEWADAETPNGEFADAAAVYFPVDGPSDEGPSAEGQAPAGTMGSADSAVDVWFWQDGLAAAKRLTGRGPGVFAPAEGDGVTAAASLADGKWSVVLSGPVPADQRIGVAVWNGSNEERAGLGAVTPEWVALAIQ